MRTRGECGGARGRRPAGRGGRGAGRRARRAGGGAGAGGGERVGRLRGLGFCRRR